jgi:2-dehydro-3-deoxyphosphooctonate aldolase (KDO 8-P synthase)
MINVIKKVESTGNRKIIVTERGASFGYNNLVADMRSLLEMRDFGYLVVLDATHSVQRPGAGGTGSGGDACWAPALARAAVATGCDAVFIETHVAREEALSDGANSIKFSEMRKLWKTLRSIDEIVS